MFIIIGIMLTGMLLGYLLRSKRLSWIHRIITLLIWILLFLLGIDVGGNESIIKGLHTLGLEAIIITVAAVAGSTLCAWGPPMVNQHPGTELQHRWRLPSGIGV